MNFVAVTIVLAIVLGHPFNKRSSTWGGGADSTRLQIVFFITSVRDAAEPRNLVTSPKI